MKVRILLSLLCVVALALPALAQGIDGKWEAKQTTQRGETVISFEFKNAGGKLTGTVTNGQQPAAEIKNGKMDGMKVSFETSQAGRGGGDPITVTWSGTLSGDSLKLTRTGGPGRGGAAPAAQELEAKRVK